MCIRDRTTVVCRHPEQKLIWVICFLGRLDEDIPVLIVLEDASVNQVVFPLFPRALCVLLDDVLVGELFLGIFVKELHVRVLQLVSGGVLVQG